MRLKPFVSFCKKKATMVLRTQDGVPVYDGEQIQIGGNETLYSQSAENIILPLNQ